MAGMVVVERGHHLVCGESGEWTAGWITGCSVIHPAARVYLTVKLVRLVAVPSAVVTVTVSLVAPAELTETRFLKVLGSYPAAQIS